MGRQWASRVFLVIGLGLAAHGGYYVVQGIQEDQYLERSLLSRIGAATPEERLEQTLRLSFILPPHKPPAPPPRYHLANPALKVLGPPASRIYQNGGHCGRRSRLLIALLDQQGIPARKIHLINRDYARFGHASEYVHAVVEAKVDDRWVVLDPLYNVMYRNRDGSLATLEEIRSDPEVFARGIAGADTTYTAYYTTLYTFDRYRKFIWSSIPGGSSAYSLLERVVGQERAREIPTPPVLETPYQAVALLSFSGAVFALAGWLMLRVRSRTPEPVSARDLPSLAGTS